MRVFVLSFVIELLQDEAAQTQNPFVILNPYDGMTLPTPDIRELVKGAFDYKNAFHWK